MYDWIKAFHIIAVIAWMAGMLYLPRLFVYHCAAEKGSVQSETFKVMERRLLRGIMHPALVGTYLFGALLAAQPDMVVVGQAADGAEAVLVLTLSALHGMLARWVKDFAADNNRHTAGFYRIINEVPTVLLIAIVILAVVKPF